MPVTSYKRHRGLPLADRVRQSVVVDAAGCWIWQLSKSSNGYGRIGIRQPGQKMQLRMAHRVAYESLVGPIPAGLELDHLCRVRDCVNPEHLEPVTSKENSRRADRSGVCRARYEGAAECKRGHAFDAANTRLTPEGWRRCRTCDDLHNRARYDVDIAAEIGASR
jgi:hypothetical protein